jgi:hypothetical protein
MRWTKFDSVWIPTAVTLAIVATILVPLALALLYAIEQASTGCAC